MTPDRQALTLARFQAIDGTPEDKALVQAWDRLFAMLNVLDSKTSALLRFNAIVVAALAYLVVVSGADPFAQSKPIIKTLGFAVGHVSLVLSVLSCGFAFPVISVARGLFDAACPGSTRMSSCGWVRWWRSARASMLGRGGSPSRADWGSPCWSRWRRFTDVGHCCWEPVDA